MHYPAGNWQHYLFRTHSLFEALEQQKKDINVTIKTLAIVLLIPFLILTAYALYAVGFVGIFDYQRHSPAGWQVFADLVISLILILTWLVPNAKAKGRNPWPWVVATLFLGVISPLVYLATAKSAEPDAV